LKKRYGINPPKLTEENIYDKFNINPDSSESLPNQGTEVKKEPWEAEIGKKSEWDSAIQNRQSNTGNDGVGTSSSHDPVEDDHCGRAIWTYKKHTERQYIVTKYGVPYWRTNVYYEKKQPINVVLKGFDISDISNILVGELEWDDLEEDLLIPNELNRFAWDKDRSRFVGPPEDQQPYNEYGGFGSTGGFGILGRIHLRCWELEPGVVSIQAHEDGSFDFDPRKFKHDVVSYENAKEEVIGIFKDYATVIESVESGRENYGNDGAGDNHNGEAVVMEDLHNPEDPPDVNC